MKYAGEYLKELVNKNDTTLSLTITFALVGIIYIIISSASILLGFLGVGYLASDNSNICYDFKTLNQTLEDIEDNCGSTFITKKWDSDDWFVFLSNVCDGKKCESKYIPLDQCVNGGKDEQ